MSKQRIDFIEKHLKAKQIDEYEIFCVEKNIYETMFLKIKADIEREVSDFEYFLRILSQEKYKTGIGIVGGNSLDSSEIDKNIDVCLLLSKSNTSPKYYFPEKKSFSKIETIDKRVLKDPVGVQRDLSEKLIDEVNKQHNVSATFGRFRLHNHNSFLRNSNGLDLENSKTFFFIEFSLKAEKDGKLAEYWNVEYFKEREHLNFEQRVEKWAKLAQDTLTAKPPLANSQAIVIFPPRVLKEALNSVIGFHSSGKAHFEKVSKFELDDVIAKDKISIIDDGLLEGGLNSSSWDGEGNPHQKTEIITQGIFKNRLYDQKYAILENTESTGNGNRSLSGSVANGISNLHMLPGDLSFDEMVSNIKEGYYIHNFSWLNPDPLSGFFGAEIRNGYYIKDGELKNPIKLGNVSGNVLQMLKDCLYISKEYEFAENSLFPYVAFSNLNVSF